MCHIIIINPLFFISDVFPVSGGGRIHANVELFWAYFYDRMPLLDVIFGYKQWT